jgi:hypothetical protein
MKASEEFVVGKHNIGWIGSNFKEHFYGMEFEMPEKSLPSVILPRYMTDKDIIAELHPGESTLGDMLFDMQSGLGLTNGYINLYYVRDKNGVLWVPYWHVFGGKFNVGADSSSRPRGWSDGRRVSGGDLSDSQPLSSGPSDTLTLPDDLTINGLLYRRV